MNYQWLFDKPIAHRGSHDIYPENSIPAYAESIKNGLNIEIDVHLSKDNHLIVFHDDSLKRVCGVNKLIKESTLDEIKQCKIFDTDFQIPTLDEFLEFIDGRTGILLEIKGTWPLDFSIVKAVIDKVKDYKGPIALQSFNFGAVAYALKHCNLPVGELCTWAAPDLHTYRWWLCNFMGHAWVCSLTKPDFISYDVNGCDPKSKENKWLKKWIKKLPIIMWTITSKEKMETAKKYANNIIFEYLPIDYVKESQNNLVPFKCKKNKIPSNLKK